MPRSLPSPSLLSGYAPPPDTFDEWVDGHGQARSEFKLTSEALANQSKLHFAQSHETAARVLLNQGVTFSVYSGDRGTERVLPFCLVPRLISSVDWARLEAGLKQRIKALENFVDDVYTDQRILQSDALLRDWVLGSKGYLPELRHIRPPSRVRIHIAGIDLVRDSAGTFRVLEDNLRTPSGVSYVLENRIISKRVIPDVLSQARVRRVDEYPARLATALKSVSPVDPDQSTAVILSPGTHNSAYFEHSFLARTMGLELVLAADLFVSNDRVYVRTTRGDRQVHVIYRRTDEAFLDPEVFRPDSLLGVRGLIRAYAKGNVALVNAPGNGVADDKAIYAFVPQMIRFYLGEEPLLEQVHTYLCGRESDRKFVIDHLGELVVKAVDEAGGYGMLMGPHATAREKSDFKSRIETHPRRYIAQHRIELSTCPTWDPQHPGLVPRRVDFRPYIVTGSEGPWVLPGGLTRVALVPGSYVVNSSQGGGSKDTWVLQAEGR